MEKKVMDKYIEEFIEKNKYSQDVDTIRKLFNKEYKNAFVRQSAYEDTDCLQENFRNSVLKIQNTAGKDAAIRVYKRFYDFLKEKGILTAVSHAESIDDVTSLSEPLTTPSIKEPPISNKNI